MPSCGRCCRPGTEGSRPSRESRLPEPVNWNALIEDVVAGRWRDPESGRPAALPFEAIELVETTEGAEADLVARLGLARRPSVESDANTIAARGRRVAPALPASATVHASPLPTGL